ncbi:two-component sensor histidine kinase [Lactococcus hodotermopsidis]|uniref:histidine kinase n=1 Tax=Pseudolactococcus hodotermopsidis TaxID=2709157 RepID=A0A6A0BAP1_9LACT|nr:HAMP domain-containing sensor histidine kinase [Lactococcus hodotermopsidis]GFH42470.1 two-component sensor histidine kinase [Lactococcus hodotermopsidis]
MITIIIATIAFLLALYLVFLLLEIRHLTRQLHFISDKETNAELTSASKIKLIRELLDENNHLIRKNKQFYREQIAKDKSLHELLTNLTHDLKTPLTVASGYTQLLLRTESPENPEIVGKIASSLTSIKQYLDYLMTYNLIQEKNISLNLERINLSSLLRESLVLYYEAFSEHKLVPNFQFLSEDKFVIADTVVLQRIFQNILGNIINHGEDFVKIVMISDKKQLTLTFSNGLRTAIDNPELLLQRFKTNEPSRTNKSTGLGLNIIQELCQLIHAELSLTVTDDEFSVTFILNLN